MKNKGYIFIAFAITALINLIGEGLDLPIVIWVSKPLLMPILLLWYLWKSKQLDLTPKLTIVSALIFSFLGDIFLLPKDNEVFFMFGLSSFLYAQVAYIITFSKDIKFKEVNKLSLLTVVALFSTASLVLFFSLLPHLGDFTIPVVIYGSIVSLMGITATLRRQFVNADSYKYTFIGALFFIISDSIIGVDKFIYQQELPFADISIMLFYLLGQFLIIKGLLLRK